MNLYNISIIAGVTAVILIACYLIIKIAVRNEMKKSLPAQIKSAQDYFGNKEIRLILLIKSNGEVEWEHFELIKRIDYVG